MRARRVAAPIGGVVTFVALMPVACVRGEGNPSARCQTLAGWTLPGFEGASTARTAYIAPIVGALLVVAVLLAIVHHGRETS